jgi:hypothetical protein
MDYCCYNCNGFGYLFNPNGPCTVCNSSGRLAVPDSVAPPQPKPELGDFGLTAEEYARYKRFERMDSMDSTWELKVAGYTFIGAGVATWVGWGRATGDWSIGFLVGLGASLTGTSVSAVLIDLVKEAIRKYYRHPLSGKVRLYEEALTFQSPNGKATNAKFGVAEGAAAPQGQGSNSLGLLPLRTPPTNGNGIGGHWCEQHQTKFRQFRKGGRSWYSYRTPKGVWCKERE